jgi:hypothetical protein
VVAVVVVAAAAAVPVVGGVVRCRMSVLFVEERTSIERQLARGKRATIHNAKVKETGIGELAPERPTDMSEKAAAKRYAIFKQHFATLTTLQQRFPFHLINAQDSIEQVHRLASPHHRILCSSISFPISTSPPLNTGPSAHHQAIRVPELS